jgi:hypothetical protein
MVFNKTLASQERLVLFSKRKGFSPVKDSIQKDGMDDPLRHGLWNALHVCIWDGNEYSHYSGTFQSSNLYGLFQCYWHNLFKIPLDNMPNYMDGVLTRLRETYYKVEWYEVYDFIEFTAQNCPEELSDSFVSFCNHVLENELSAYRFVGKQLTDITSEEEIESIEEAIKSSTKFTGASEHLKTSLGFLSDRKSPDYRNSIKESISAVESLCKAVSDDPKGTLGSALKQIEKSHNLHPAFKKALSNLYGYTHDSGGIRHALLEEDSISYSDAKYMLVSCSAFINYVLGKVSEKS